MMSKNAEMAPQHRSLKPHTKNVCGTACLFFNTHVKLRICLVTEVPSTMCKSGRFLIAPNKEIQKLPVTLILQSEDPKINFRNQLNKSKTHAQFIIMKFHKNLYKMF
jgi:hypothetical protein